jgi:hypothetical protein
MRDEKRQLPFFIPHPSSFSLSAVKVCLKRKTAIADITRRDFTPKIPFRQPFPAAAGSPTRAVGGAMRRWRISLLTAAAGLALANAGCFLNLYPADHNERMDVLLNQSEDLRQMQGVWRRFWFTDQPSHLTYQRVHGGIGPGDDEGP